MKWVFFVSFYKPPERPWIYTAMMACSMKSCVYCLSGTIVGSKSRGFCPSLVSVQPRDSKSRALPMLGVEFMGKPLPVSDQKDLRGWSLKSPSSFSPHVCQCSASICFYILVEVLVFIPFWELIFNI